MLKGRGRDPRSGGTLTTSNRDPRSGGTLTIAHQTSRLAVGTQRIPVVKPEPDYEIVEFPSEQYVNAKLQPPPPPPPRPLVPLSELNALCGLCGGGGARVRCSECGSRSLCSSCDEMYHRHPKRRNHQRQTLPLHQVGLRIERPPLPPKVTPPVPPPRRHKISGDRSSASPRPALNPLDQRRDGLPFHANAGPFQTLPVNNHFSQAHQPMSMNKLPKVPSSLATAQVVGMPYYPSNLHPAPQTMNQLPDHTNTMGAVTPSWARQRGSFQGYNLPPHLQQAIPNEMWESPDSVSPNQSFGRPLRRGGSVFELPGGGTGCAGCGHCAPTPWRYGSCANLDHPWFNSWSQAPAGCCPASHPPHSMHHIPHSHPPRTPQPSRRMESRTMSRTGSRAGSRAPSPAMSVRSRASRRNKHRTPSPPPLPSSSDADSESESDSDRLEPEKTSKKVAEATMSLGPPPTLPNASWQCEHCTFVNDPGTKVCAVCCKTPTAAPKVIETNVDGDMSQLSISNRRSPSVERKPTKNSTQQNGGTSKTKKERASTGCGPSPPREHKSKKNLQRLATPTRDESRSHQDIAVGTSFSHEVESTSVNKTGISSKAEVNTSPLREVKASPKIEKHSVSVGPSPPRDNFKRNDDSTLVNVQKKSTGTSPPRDTIIEARTSTAATRLNTGTSPPPQTISTQTYDDPSSWQRERERERAASTSRSRARHRMRDDSRRERSHSRHSLSSDTRESERSARTSGGGRWEWVGRDSSPGGGDWSGSERRARPPRARTGVAGLAPSHAERLARRASHLDLRARQDRRTSYFEGASPEPFSSTRAVSLEALVAISDKQETERGLELARLMNEAERLGFSAAEVQAALAQSPSAPLGWLRERWPSLCAGVRAAALRLAPNAPVSERDARAALAKHRGAMWPAVTECVDRYKRQGASVASSGEASEARRVNGRVWGPPAGPDDDAEPPRSRAEDSSDEYDLPVQSNIQEDDWMYLPFDRNDNVYESETYTQSPGNWDATLRNTAIDNTNNIANKLKTLLIQAGIPAIDENLLLRGLLSSKSLSNPPYDNLSVNNIEQNIGQSVFLGQSENEFINAYNALTRSSPLPNIMDPAEDIKMEKSSADSTSNNNGLDENKNTVSENVLNSSDQIGNSDEYMGATQIRTFNLIANEEKQINQNLTPDIIEDKSNNLSDIVDNTQKLIQQMKEEITSDINSYDDMSHSEDAQSSSSDSGSSEHESTYSDTEHGTDEFSSDERHSFPFKNKINKVEEEINQTKSDLNRTSSEDNEQFEEAIDQFEETQENNVKLLDSIARSIQEESVALVNTNQLPKREQSIQPSKQIQKHRRYDFNNNFTKVNSFDEIYEELNGNNNLNDAPDTTQIKTETIQNQITNQLIVKSYPEKHDLIISQFKIDTPKQVVITTRTHSICEAVLEFTPQHNELNDIAYIDDISVNETVAEPLQESNNVARYSDISIEQNSQYVPNKESMYVPSSTNSVLSTGNQDLKPITTLNEHTVPDNANNENSLSQNDVNLSTDKKPSINEDSLIHTRTSVSPERSETNNDFVIQSNMIENNDVMDATHNKVEGNNSTDSKTMNKNVKSKIVNDKSMANNENSKGFTLKSSIPKLIKALQNNKQKAEKPSKVITSKVPIRRSSVKQYAAPAPPKTKFGSIQSGHVKHLQAQVFNNSPLPKTTISMNSQTIPSKSVEIKTPTLGKKKPAPLPPTAIPSVSQERNISPKTSPSKEKKTYFRETCRTEDEWSENDSDDSQVIKKTDPEPDHAPPSPPPPPTVRRVSGRLIDLTKVQLPEGSPERQARMVLAAGAAETWEQAQLAVALVARGADPPAALLAALQCTDLAAALVYLHQDCHLCASKLPEHEMVSMLRCTHRCCRECARHYFTVQITERSIADCVCPYCKAPDLESLHEDSWLEYFSHLDILLKTLIENDVHELFQRKLRDRTLARDPNFRWCVECSSGFFVHPKQKRIRCPECRSVTCATCRKPWSQNHEGLSCEQYGAWLEDNDPERSVAAVHQHLKDNGLECPRCRFKYSLSRGGCMHFTCTQCKYEFCYGCGKPFMMGARCGLSEYCAKLGLHAHHPRNCLFYLRDKEPHELQTLLQMNNVSYETEPAEGTSATGRCPVQLQRETPTGLVDGACASDVPPHHGGLCKLHYVEYLAALARPLDPIPIMEVSELVAELRRRALPLPERGPWDTDPIYAGMCAEIVKDKIPLD